MKKAKFKLDIETINEWIWDYSAILDINADITYRFNSLTDEYLCLAIVETPFDKSKAPESYDMMISIKDKKLIPVEEWVVKNKKYELALYKIELLNNLDRDIYDYKSNIYSYKKSIERTIKSLKEMEDRRAELSAEYKEITGEEWENTWGEYEEMMIKKQTYRISTEYSYCPGSRYISEGKYSGEDFRDNHLSKIIKECIDNHIQLTIDLDGSAGYGSGFLEEVFGGLIREHNFDIHDLIRMMHFKSDEEPYLIDEIMKYMALAEIKSVWDRSQILG